MTAHTSAFRARLAALLLIPALGACGGTAPEGPTPAASPDAAAATITAADLGREIGALAHDSMAGRDTPSPELEKAAAYLAGRFEAMGLQPAGDDGGYIHRFDYPVSRLVAEETVVRVKGEGEPARYERDYFMVAGMAPVESDAYYVGVAGESGPPPADARGRILVFDHPGGTLDQQWQMRIMGAVQAAMAAQSPAVVVVLDPEFPGEVMSQLAQATAGQQAPFPVVGITDEAARQLFQAAGADLAALRSAGEPAPLADATLEIRTRRETATETPPNVAAVLPGSDPALSGTYVVLTAHFDHVGVGSADASGDSIFNGADDDASGTAAVLEIAEAFAALDAPPARSVLFLLVSGEEKGLLGSKAWVADPTIDDVESIVANVNLDMVGRDPLPDTVIGIGQEYTSLEGVLQGIVDARPELNLTVILDPKPEEQYFFRSDQLPFIQNGIPAVFFTTGEHEDYHKQSDEPEAIDTDKAARVARLGFYLAWEIANSAREPEWTEEGQRQVQQMLQGGM